MSGRNHEVDNRQNSDFLTEGQREMIEYWGEEVASVEVLLPDGLPLLTGEIKTVLKVLGLPSKDFGRLFGF